MKRMILLLAMLAGVGFSTTAHATLMDRGGGLIYDTDRNITWLQDANYAKTSGYDADGLMTWSQAVTWADNLVYHDSMRNVDYNDWRLPTTMEQVNGTRQDGYNITSSEMGHLFYSELGGAAGSSIVTTHNANYNLFANVKSYAYCSDTAFSFAPYDPWYFRFDYGLQYAHDGSYSQYYAWAVRDGDVAPVPEPGTWLLLGSGLVGLVAMRKRLGGC